MRARSTVEVKEGNAGSEFPLSVVLPLVLTFAVSTAHSCRTLGRVVVLVECECVSKVEESKSCLLDAKRCCAE